MSPEKTDGHPAKATHPVMRPKEGNGFFQFLRQSHIFSSAVREVLETKLLREATSMPLTISQFHLLKLMLVDGKHQVGQVADYLGVSAPAATKSVDKLERLDLVVRSPSKGDRRATLLSVSPKGRRLVRKYEDLKAERLAPILERFKPEEIESLTELLERFSISLLGEGEAENEFCLRCAGYLAEGCSIGLMRGGCPHKKNQTGVTGDAEARGRS
jgi:DNA-binding MarR family transcriptional regulator